MLPYQERVVAEKKDLDDKIAKLWFFLEHDGRGLPEPEQDLLKQQFNTMGIYSVILGQRIAAFSK